MQKSKRAVEGGANKEGGVLCRAGQWQWQWTTHWRTRPRLGTRAETQLAGRAVAAEGLMRLPKVAWSILLGA